MNTIHKNKTPEQIQAIENLLDKLLSIKPRQLNMRTIMQQGHTNNECNTIGCLVAWTLIANTGHNEFIRIHQNKDCSEISEAKDILGLTEGQCDRLFVPTANTANILATQGRASIDHRRATLAVWYFLKVGRIAWNTKKLEAYEAKHPLPQLRGQKNANVLH